MKTIVRNQIPIHGMMSEEIVENWLERRTKESVCLILWPEYVRSYQESIAAVLSEQQHASSCPHCQQIVNQGRLDHDFLALVEQCNFIVVDCESTDHGLYLYNKFNEEHRKILGSPPTFWAHFQLWGHGKQMMPEPLKKGIV